VSQFEPPCRPNTAGSALSQSVLSRPVSSRPASIATVRSAQCGAVQSGMIALIVVVLLIGAAAYWQTQQSAAPSQTVITEAAVTTEVPPSADVQPVVEPALALYPARLSLVTDANGQLVGCLGVVGDAALRQQLVQQISAVFIGQYQPCDIRADAAYQTDLMDINAVTRLAQILRDRPHTMLAINHLNMVPEEEILGVKGAVVIGVAVDSDFSKIEAAVREQTGNAFSLHQLLPVDQAEVVLQSVQTAHQMLKTLPATPRPADITALLNQQMLRFRFDDATIPALNQPLLELVTPHVQQHSDLQLQIRAYTAAVGSPQYSQELSSRRAEAVRQMWIEQGVAPERLLAVGMGQRQPIAENATEQGQFWNERIEFEWVQPVVDTVAASATTTAADTDLPKP